MPRAGEYLARIVGEPFNMQPVNPNYNAMTYIIMRKEINAPVNRMKNIKYGGKNDDYACKIV